MAFLKAILPLRWKNLLANRESAVVDCVRYKILQVEVIHLPAAVASLLSTIEKVQLFFFLAASSTLSVVFAEPIHSVRALYEQRRPIHHYFCSLVHQGGVFVPAPSASSRLGLRWWPPSGCLGVDWLHLILFYLKREFLKLNLWTSDPRNLFPEIE